LRKALHGRCSTCTGTTRASPRLRGGDNALIAIGSAQVYVHFEQEEPNHTAALTAGSPETTLEDLLQDFLRSYVEHYGEGAADLDADFLELRSSKCAPATCRARRARPCSWIRARAWHCTRARSWVCVGHCHSMHVGCSRASREHPLCFPRGDARWLSDRRSACLCRQKKLKRNALVSAQVNDRDDIFVVQGAAPAAGAKKPKPAKKARAAGAAPPTPNAQSAPKPSPVSVPAGRPSPPPQPAASAAPVPAAATKGSVPTDSDDEAEAEQAAEQLEQRLRAMAVAKAMEEGAAHSETAGNGKKADKFTHQFDRKVLGESDGYCPLLHPLHACPLFYAPYMPTYLPTCMHACMHAYMHTSHLYPFPAHLPCPLTHPHRTSPTHSSSPPTTPLSPPPPLSSSSLIP